MKKILLLVLTLLLFSGCSKKVGTPKIEEVINPVIISQDTWDRDNFSLVTTALAMEKQGLITVLAFDVTGRDLDNKAGLLFSLLTDKPIFINHGHIITRVTKSSARYSNLNHYPNDGLLDTQREDSTTGLAERLNASPTPITYVVGGHLYNLASLMRMDMELVKSKIKTVVISTGWTSRTDGKPEMNLSEGLNKPSGTSADTIYVFNNLPKNIKIVLSHDPDLKHPDINQGIISNDALAYLVKNGTYASKPFHMGDFVALLYGTTGTSWYGNVWSKEVKTCFKTNSYGAVTIKSGDCNHYYLDNVSSSLTKAVFEEKLKEGK